MKKPLRVSHFRLLLALIAGPAALAAEPVTGTLVIDNDCLDFDGELSGRVMPRSGPTLPLSPQRPRAIRKEPVYRGTPLYGRIRLGNGPRAETHFVVDRLPDDRRTETRVFFDRDHDGDLTNEGDGSISNHGKSIPGARVGPNFFRLPVSWGENGRETSSGEFCVMFLIGADKAGGAESVLTRAAAARVGHVTIAGTAVRVALIETGCDALYDVTAAVPATKENFAQRGTKHMTLLVDADSNGEFGALEVFDACLPFRIGKITYELRASLDGARVEFIPTDRPPQVVTPPARPTASKDGGLLPRGTPAPDFTVDRFGGGQLRLSELRGKTVVLDFWATWCIPCIRAMPHVQKTVARAGADVVWLGLCVWDDRKKFDLWVPANDSKYSFVKVFDPAAMDRSKSIASQLYKVTGIPTIYVIGPDGKIVAGLSGYLGDDDDRLSKALAAVKR